MKVKIEKLNAIEDARVSYDPNAEALFVLISDLKIKRNIVNWYPTILDVDKNGRLLGIEVLTPKDRWIITKDLSVPRTTITGTARLMEEKEENTIYKTNEEHSILCIQTEGTKPSFFIKLINDITLGVSSDNQLIEIWINNIR